MPRDEAWRPMDRTFRTSTIVNTLLAAMLAVVTLFSVAGGASEAEAPFFGTGNIPLECLADMQEVLDDGEENPAYWLAHNSEAVCHHMRSDMNGLDSPKVDVLVLAPVSPTVERDMRIMRQSVEMWEAGIDYIADQLGLQWLSEGMSFHITVEAIDLEDGGEFTTYPIVDPEIVVIATNPAGGVGIGIDPIDFTGDGLGIPPGGEGLCHGVHNPFDIAAWEALPGFNSHHEERSGTYVEDCDGAGGTICFAVNGAIDPTPGSGPLGDFFSLYDLVSHEVGHCLTIGHVGDGAEGSWGGLPPNDIMAYDDRPVGANKCVSTLTVVGIATVMSRYLDVNGDGVVDAADELFANDPIGDGTADRPDPFIVERPTTGEAAACPQPARGLVPGPRVDVPPEPADDGDDAPQ